MANYFSIPAVQPKVLEYVRLYPIDKNAANAIFTDLYPDILKVIRGVINRHRFQLKEEQAELECIAMNAILSSLHRYDPNHACSGNPDSLLFSYLSLIARRSIEWSLSRGRKHTNTLSIYQDDDLNLADLVEDERNYNSSVNDIVDKLNLAIRPLFKHKRYKRLEGIYKLFIIHLKQYGMFDKRAFIKFCVKEIQNGNLVLVNRATGQKLNKLGFQTLMRRLLRLIKQEVSLDLL